MESVEEALDVLRPGVSSRAKGKEYELDPARVRREMREKIRKGESHDFMPAGQMTADQAPPEGLTTISSNRYAWTPVAPQAMLENMCKSINQVFAPQDLFTLGVRRTVRDQTRRLPQDAVDGRQRRCNRSF